jgi:hypothetical protein
MIAICTLILRFCIVQNIFCFLHLLCFFTVRALFWNYSIARSQTLSTQSKRFRRIHFTGKKRNKFVGAGREKTWDIYSESRKFNFCKYMSKLYTWRVFFVFSVKINNKQNNKNRYWKTRIDYWCESQRERDH